MSKAYAFQAGFQPQDLVKERLPGSGQAFRADKEPEQRLFIRHPLVEKKPLPPSPEAPVEAETEILAAPAVETAVMDEVGAVEIPEHDAATLLTPAEIEQLVTDAYQRGRRAGLAAGREQVKNDFDAAIAVVLNIGQELDSLRQTILENSQGELQALALAIAEKVTRRSVQEQSETIARTVEEAVRLAISSEKITVLVNPADYQTIMDKSGQLKAGVTGLRALTIRADDGIEQGGCRLESDNCIVDATMAGQLADIALRLQNQA